jgi:hypothetical protein
LTIATVALIGAIPLAIAVVLVAIFGVETRQRRLEGSRPRGCD